MSVSENIKSLIDNLEGPYKWKQEGQVVFSKNFDFSELEKEELLNFGDVHKPFYSIAKVVIGAHSLIQDTANKEENAKMLINFISILDDIKNILQNK